MLSICFCGALVFIGACLCYGATSFWKPSSSLFLSATTAEIVHGKRRSFLRAGNVKSELPSLRVDMGSNIFHTFYNGHPTTDITNWITLKKEPTFETHSFQTLFELQRMGKTMQKPPPGSRACEKHVLLRMILEGNKVFPQHSWSKVIQKNYGLKTNNSRNYFWEIQAAIILILMPKTMLWRNSIYESLPLWTHESHTWVMQKNIDLNAKYING